MLGVLLGWIRTRKLKGEVYGEGVSSGGGGTLNFTMVMDCCGAYNVKLEGAYVLDPTCILLSVLYVIGPCFLACDEFIGLKMEKEIPISGCNLRFALFILAVAAFVFWGLVVILFFLFVIGCYLWCHGPYVRFI